jgi:predicted acyl esterase
MIKTSFLDINQMPTTMDKAELVMCIEIDDYNNILSKKIFRNSSKVTDNKFFTRNFEEHHWENAIAMQKIIDNLWQIYHQTQDNEKKAKMSMLMMGGYLDLDKMISNIEYTRFNKGEYHGRHEE